jgi:hypothetical protein
MNPLEALGGTGGIAAMARELGIDEKTAMAGAAALLPAVMGGFKSQASQAGGLEGLVGMLGGMGGGNLLDAVLAPQATPVDQGNAVLGQIFGSPEVSRAVAGQAAGSTGISADLLKKMLPMLAMAAAGMMAKSASAGTAAAPQGGLGGLIGQVTSMLGGGQAGGMDSMAGLAKMIDMDGDGNPLDDIMGMLGKR